MALVLLENCTDSKARCIRGDDKGECGVQDAENQSVGESSAEGVEGSLGLGGPGVRGVFVRELCQGGGDAGVVGDKTMVVIADAEERLQFFERGGHGPGLNSLDFLGISGDALVRNNVAKV